MCENKRDKKYRKPIDVTEKHVLDYWKKINNDRLISDLAEKLTAVYNRLAQNDSGSDQDSYQQSYSYLRSYGENCCKREQYIVLSHAVYGWMPTVLEIDYNSIGCIENAINHFKDFDFTDLKDEDIRCLRTVAKFTNNSFVGASKLLHFIFPNKFAIWDSTILKVLESEKINYSFNQKQTFFQKSGANLMTNFWGYQFIMHKTLQQINMKSEQPVSLRDIEKTLFYSIPEKERAKCKDK